MNPSEQSAPPLGAFVDRVVAATGASKVNLVGRSEGTFMPQYWLKFLGGSSMVNLLNQGDAAVPGVAYTTIMTTHDELVVPYTSRTLNASNATNIVLQNVSPNDLSEHVAEAFDPVVAQRTRLSGPLEAGAVLI